MQRARAGGTQYSAREPVTSRRKVRGLRFYSPAACHVTSYHAVHTG